MEVPTEKIIYTDKDFNPDAIHINPNYRYTETRGTSVLTLLRETLIIHQRAERKFIATMKGIANESTRIEKTTSSTRIPDTGW